MVRSYIGIMFLLVLLAGCGLPGLASSAPPAAQMLQNSINTMNQLKSAHIDVQATLTTQVGTGTSPVGANGATFSLNGRSDVAGPDQVAVSIQVGSVPLVTLVSTGQKVYIQGKNNTWLVFERSQMKEGAQSFFTVSLLQHMTAILTLAQNARLTDQGPEQLGGETLEHITATLDGRTLQQLGMQLNGLLSSGVQSQLQKATLDLWIDQTTWYIHQAQLDLVAQGQSSAAPVDVQQTGGSSTTRSVELKIQLNFSKLNESVTIPIPVNATPFAG